MFAQTVLIASSPASWILRALVLALSILIGSSQTLAQGNPQGRTVATAEKAQQEKAGPVWASLTYEQQKALAPLKPDWGSIEPDRKAKWLELASKFSAMPAAEQNRVHERMREWARLTPSQRGQARLSYQQARQLSPSDRQARWAEYQGLDADQRTALQRKASATTATPTAPVQAGAQPPKVVRQVVPAPDSRPAPKAAKAQELKAVSPTLVQGTHGASTTLISRTLPAPSSAPATKPTRPQAVISLPEHVNRSTLLPKAATPATTAAQSQPPAQGTTKQ